MPTCVGPINVDLCLALDESGSVCYKTPSLCTGGTCDVLVDPITGMTTKMMYRALLAAVLVGFKVNSFEEAELVIDAVLDQIDIPCPP